MTLALNNPEGFGKYINLCVDLLDIFKHKFKFEIFEVVCWSYGVYQLLGVVFPWFTTLW